MHTTTPSIRRHAPRLLALALLGALAMPAFAQSAEYRRGYDEGYRAGVAAAQSGNVQSPTAHREAETAKAHRG